AQTNPIPNNCPVGPDRKFWLQEFDMVFNANRLWHISLDPAGISLNERDFFSTALHELGHAHLLQHTLPGDKIMHGFGQNGAAGIRRNLTAFDIQGGNYVVNLSTDSISCNTGVVQDSMSLFVCSTMGIENLPENKIQIFPNPATHKIQIYSDNPKWESVSLTSLQGTTMKSWKWRKGLNGMTLELDSHISAGFYFLMFTSQTENYVSPIIISK
ncbi:zinc-dependent metalloprotease, partial [bacterium]|nr:zinc-dependent metalloprotease [bacterium]